MTGRHRATEQPRVLRPSAGFLTELDTPMAVITAGDDWKPADLTAMQAIELAARVARRRGAVQVVAGVEVQVTTEPDHHVHRVEVRAVFANGPDVVGSTHSIDAADWDAHALSRFDEWQIIAAANLIAQFRPLSDAEVHECRM